nr:H-NS histone family protein [Burkholderia cepacia]
MRAFRSVRLQPISVDLRRRSAAKYRDPKTGATWSGRGRAPAWIKDAKNRDRFLIQE